MESITFFTEEDLEQSLGNDIYKDQNYVKAKGILNDIDSFDASFFGVNPREAEIMSPQHRIFLECSWEVLESAGYDPEKYRGRIGVYAGEGGGSYLFKIYNNRDLLRTVNDFQISLGNDKDHLATQVSYKLNLKGPAITVQTACSTSLVAE